ncbi:hypothetical protein Tco_0054435 [Tanacetum coccineum]
MAAVEVPQTLKYRGGQLNAAPVLEVENFTNWKERFMCDIHGIERQFENIIKNDPFIPMTDGQRKLEGQWTVDERKAANLDQYEENLIDSIYETEKSKSLISTTPLSTGFISTSIVQDLQDSPDNEEDTRKSHEYLNDLEEEYQARALLAKSKRFFKKSAQRFSSAKTSVPSYPSPFQPKLLHSSEHKPEPRHTKDFKAKYNKVKAKLALLSSSASALNSSSGKNKGLIAESYDWDEEVSSDDNDVTKVKALMALADEERVSVGKESARNDYLCIDLNYVEEQRNNLMSKHRNLVQELNTCKEQVLILKQAKLDLLTMQHVNTKILKENQNLRNELKELTSIIELWAKRVFVKSSANNSEVSITGSNKPKLFEDEDSTLSNHDTANESSVCSTPLPPLEKLTGAEPVSGPKTIKSILKSNSHLKLKL